MTGAFAGGWRIDPLSAPGTITFRRGGDPGTLRPATPNGPPPGSTPAAALP